MKQKIFGCFLLIFAMIIALPILCFAEEVTEEVTEESVEFDGTSVVFSVDCSSGFFENSLNNTILSSSTWPTTPNGNDVTWARRRTEAVTSETLRTTLHDEMASQHSIRKYLGVASTVYNCHSYAWNSQDIGYNLYWIEWPEDYITDGSYTLVTGTPKPGDIVCYVDEDSPVGYQRIHSAILVKIVGNYNNLSGIIVQSKWGDYGLYEHYGNQSPYPATDSVEYYRLTGHSTHTFAYSANNSFMGYDAEDMDDCHAKYCTGCGVTIWEDHKAVTYTGITSTSHTGYCICGASMGTKAHQLGSVVDYDDAGHVWRCACGYQVEEPHHYTEYTAAGHTGECNICDYVAITTEAHTIIYSNNGDGTHTRACTGCEYSATELHDCVYTPVDIYGHDVTCTYCSYAAEDQTHSWDDGYDAEGNQYNYCTQCGYESDYVPMTAEMIATLSLEEQRALMQSIQTANSEFVLYLDAERGVLYQDGVCYLFYVPANVEVSVYLQPIDLATTQPVYPLPEVTE